MTQHALTGDARYIADIQLPDCLEVGFVRSHEAHAVVDSVDVRPALAVPGVVDAFSASDIPEYLGPLPLRVDEEGCEPFLQGILASDRVRYIGEPLAVLVGDRDGVLDGVMAVEAHLSGLPVNLSVDQKGASSYPLFEVAPGNIMKEMNASVGAPDRALAEVDLIVEETFRVGRHTAIPLDPGGVAARWDRSEERLSIWGLSKVPHANRRLLARVLGLEESQISLYDTAVGGGFGVRGELYPEEVLTAVAAIRRGGAVRWLPTRSEHFVAFNHSREQVWRVQMGLTASGQVTVLDVTLYGDQGAYIRHMGTKVPVRAADHFVGPYRVENYRCRVLCVATNKTPIGPYRSPGNFEATFVRERLLDIAASRLSIDPLVLRRANLIPRSSMPYDTGIKVGAQRVVYDSGDFSEPLDIVADRLAKRNGVSETSVVGAANGSRHKYGKGVAVFVDRGGFGPPEVARLSVNGKGAVTIQTGAPSLGQGHETSLPKVASNVLGISVDQITVQPVDTDRIETGGGTFASRGAVVVASAVHLAAEKLRDQIVSLAARRWGTTADALVLSGGRIQHRDNRMEMAVDELVDGTGDISAEASFRVENEPYSYGAVGVEVQVDEDTGTVRVLRAILAAEVGHVLDLEVVRGQLQGALVQGLGGALLEDILYSDSGEPLTTSLMGYALPDASHVPPKMEVVILDNFPSPLTPLGTKGAGELGIVGVGGAVANAVAAAVGGNEHSQVLELPITPERALAAIRRSSLP